MMYGCAIAAAKLLLLQHISTLSLRWTPLAGTCYHEGNVVKYQIVFESKLFLRKERVAMSASDDSKVVVRDRSGNRAIWVRPTLRRLAANKAENGSGMCNDGMGGGCGPPLVHPS
jgi:hypothetical protein